MYVVEYDWLSMARSFREANISRNHGLEYLGAEEAAKIGCDLLRKRGAVVVHRQQDALDSKRGIDGPAEAHERIEKFGDTFESQILALDGNKN